MATRFVFISRVKNIWLFNKQNLSFQLLEFKTDADIISINPYSDKELIIATRTEGFFTYHTETKESVHFHASTHHSLPGNKVLSVYVDRYKEVWFNLADAQGVTHFNPFTKAIKHEIPLVEEGSAYRSQPAFSIHEDGSITAYKLSDYNIDRVNSGKMLFQLYDYTKDDKIKKAIDLLRSQLDTHPRNDDGGFWHKKIYPHQVWLDGVYMGTPFMAEYAARYNRPEDFMD